MLHIHFKRRGPYKKSFYFQAPPSLFCVFPEYFCLFSCVVACFQLFCFCWQLLSRGLVLCCGLILLLARAVLRIVSCCDLPPGAGPAPGLCCPPQLSAWSCGIGLRQRGVTPVAYSIFANSPRGGFDNISESKMNITL